KRYLYVRRIDRTGVRSAHVPGDVLGFAGIPDRRIRRYLERCRCVHDRKHDRSVGDTAESVTNRYLEVHRSCRRGKVFARDALSARRISTVRTDRTNARVEYRRFVVVVQNVGKARKHTAAGFDRKIRTESGTETEMIVVVVR